MKTQTHFTVTDVFIVTDNGVHCDTREIYSLKYRMSPKGPFDKCIFVHK